MTNEEFVTFMNGHIQPCNQTLAAHIVEADQEAGRVVTMFEARPEFCHSRNTIVQGGFLCAMADSVMTHALLAVIGFGFRVPTLELKMSFLAATGPGPIRGVGQLLRRGRSVAFMEGSLYDGSGTMIARASTTAKINPRKSAG